MSPENSYFRFEHTYKSFNGVPVLIDVSFDVLPGETVAILGRSGVGKSVTLKHIVGFLKPDQGRVWVAGRDITDATEDELTEIRKRVAMVFQSGALFDSLTVAENVGFPLEEREDISEEEKERRVFALLQEVELEEYAHHMPADLSTGMKRAVAIARALAAEPDAVLYDEPTTMVDPLMAQTITELIAKLKEKFRKTSVVVTHDVRLATRLADRMVFLHEGRVAFFGTVAAWGQSQEEIIRDFRVLDALPALGAPGP
jgi:phospholipid/cholesterol/gamma-HCH transport system ATP-binding protein